MTHTKTPWTIKKLLASNGKVYDCIYGQDKNEDKVVAQVFGNGHPNEYHINSAHIVHCVNVHDQLVEALQSGRRAVEKMKREYIRLQPDAAPNECWAEVEAFEALLHDALAQAEKGAS